MDARAVMEGVWRLDLWDDGETEWQWPSAKGRFILRDNVVIFMASRPLADGGTYSRHAYGVYAYEDGRWAYGYDYDLCLWESAQSIRANHDLSWDGLKSFAIEERPPQLMLSTDDGRYRLVFEGHRMLYFEDETLIRAWSKVS